MNKISLSQLSAVWKEHVLQRASEAMKIGLIEPKDCIDLHSGVVIFPSGIDEDCITNSRPDTTVNELQSVRHEAFGKWTERLECLEGAAEALHELCYKEKQAFIFCEAGYLKLGDKFLTQYDYVVVNGDPLLLVDVLKSSTADIAKILRASRSTRILGVVKVEVPDKNIFLGRHKLFICDALDGDSVFVSSLIHDS